MDEQRVKCIQTFMRKSAQTEQVIRFSSYNWLTSSSCRDCGNWYIPYLSSIQCQIISPGRASNHSPVSWGHPALHRLYGWKRGWKWSKKYSVCKCNFVVFYTYVILIKVIIDMLKSWCTRILGLLLRSTSLVFHRLVIFLILFTFPCLPPKLII